MWFVSAGYIGYLWSVLLYKSMCIRSQNVGKLHKPRLCLGCKVLYTYTYIHKHFIFFTLVVFNYRFKVSPVDGYIWLPVHINRGYVQLASGWHSMVALPTKPKPLLHSYLNTLVFTTLYVACSKLWGSWQTEINILYIIFFKWSFKCIQHLKDSF